MRDIREEEQFQMVMAKRRIQVAAGAENGRIGDPGEFLLALVEWGEENGFENDATLLRKVWEANYGNAGGGVKRQK